MSSPRVQKLFQAMPQQIKGLGKYDVVFTDVLRWAGRVDSTNDLGLIGHDACILDFDAYPSWASGQKRVIITAEPASDYNNTSAMKTQSHAAGNFIDGSVRLHLWLETPGAVTDAQSAFVRNVVQHVRGQLAAPCQLHYTADGTQPAIKGVAGAGASAAFTAAEWMLPYSMVYPGGV